jgi:hypothetical protein
MSQKAPPPQAQLYKRKISFYSRIPGIVVPFPSVGAIAIGGPSMRALNFYSSVYHGFLVSRDKTCTIRLGDKTYKYQDGDVVLVTYGDKFKPRKKVFTAVIDQVKVKQIRELTLEDLQGENPEMQSPQDAVDFLSQIYKSPITLDSMVTVVHFSEIVE